MMLEYEVQRCTRKCCRTERELRPGEVFYSALYSKAAEVVREDYSQEAWEGPPEHAIGWWKSQMPEPNARKMHWAPNDVMLHYFEQLADQSDKADTRYVLALLMIRRRIVRLEETETDDQDNDVLVLYCPRNENEYRVPVVSPDEQRIEQIQKELAELLYADAA